VVETKRAFLARYCRGFVFFVLPNLFYLLQWPNWVGQDVYNARPQRGVFGHRTPGITWRHSQIVRLLVSADRKEIGNGLFVCYV